MDRVGLRDALCTTDLLERMEGAALSVLADDPNAWAEAKDAVQDAIVSALASVERWGARVGEGGVEGYVVMIAMNKAKDRRDKGIRRRDRDREMPADEMLEPYYACGESDPETVTLSTNPLYTLACLIDSAPLANRKTAVELFCSDPGTFTRHPDKQEAGKLRSRKDRLRVWTAENAARLGVTENGLDERVTNALCFARKLIQRRVYPDTDIALREVAARYCVPENQLYVALFLYGVDFQDLSKAFRFCEIYKRPDSLDAQCPSRTMADGINWMYAGSYYVDAMASVTDRGESAVSAMRFAKAWQFSTKRFLRDAVVSFAVRRLRRNALLRVLQHILNDQFDSRTIDVLVEP